MDNIVHSLAWVFCAGDVPSLVEGAERILKAALALASLFAERGESRPAMAFIVRAIGKRQHDELVACWKVERPHGGHNADAHTAPT